MADRDSSRARTAGELLRDPALPGRSTRASSAPTCRSTAPRWPQRQASGDHIDGQTAGVSAFLRGHDLKIQVDYTHLRTADVVSPAGDLYSPDSHRLRVSAQLMF